MVLFILYTFEISAELPSTIVSINLLPIVYHLINEESLQTQYKNIIIIKFWTIIRQGASFSRYIWKR